MVDYICTIKCVGDKSDNYCANAASDVKWVKCQRTMH